MYPELFHIGPFTVYSYGLMLGIAFLVASWLLNKELERKNINKNYGTEITLLAIVFGIVGSKLFHLLENFSDFLKNPIGMAFNPGGLTFFGGLILAGIAVVIYTRRKKIPFLLLADAAAPALALAYGIGRIGCHLAGDGDYGIPTTLPWGTNYANGTVPPSAMFRGSEIANSFPGGIVPDTTPLHPTPIYELIVAIIIFSILWKLRKNDWVAGKLFMIYLIFTGTARLLVETIRLNPRYIFNLSEAQIISVFMIFGGVIGVIYFSKKIVEEKLEPQPEPASAKKGNVKDKKHDKASSKG
ncbi:MAG: prolipoprotein diacylglyceryl transferase [Ignavibacteriaceae bacterium]|nr:prolipoprotein diacylglyceryl transferase [Ignavibacteriaceae bacterium]